MRVKEGAEPLVALVPETVEVVRYNVKEVDLFLELGNVKVL